MRILALDSALARCSAALVVDQVLIAERRQDGAQGQAAALPVLTRDVLARAGVGPGGLDAIAATVGPGGFTGIRAGLAMAHGLALGFGVPVIGVTVPEAMVRALPDTFGRALWTAIDSRRGRVFLDRGDGPAAWPLDALPPTGGPVVIAGDAAIAVMARLAARGDDVMLTDIRLPSGWAIALVAEDRLCGRRPALSAAPLYVDAPEVRLPATAPRPPPRP